MFCVSRSVRDNEVESQDHDEKQVCRWSEDAGDIAPVSFLSKFRSGQPGTPQEDFKQ